MRIEITMTIGEAQNQETYEFDSSNEADMNAVREFWKDQDFLNETQPE